MSRTKDGVIAHDRVTFQALTAEIEPITEALERQKGSKVNILLPKFKHLMNTLDWY